MNSNENSNTNTPIKEVPINLIGIQNKNVINESGEMITNELNSSIVKNEDNKKGDDASDSSEEDLFDHDDEDSKIQQENDKALNANILDSLFSQKTLPKDENELLLDFINDDDTNKKRNNKSLHKNNQGNMVQTKVLDDMSNWQATVEINDEFGATNTSFKTCKGINEINDIVNDIDVQTFDDFEMSKRINNDKSNKNNQKMSPSPVIGKKDNMEQSLKWVKNDDIDFDQVSE